MIKTRKDFTYCTLSPLSPVLHVYAFSSPLARKYCKEVPHDLHCVIPENIHTPPPPPLPYVTRYLSPGRPSVLLQATVENKRL